MSANSQNYEASRDIQCQEIALQTMAVARQFLIKDVVTARNINAAIEELLEAMFSVNSVETTKSSIQVSQQSVLRWPPACEDMRLEAEERPLLEDFTKQSIGD
jgi:dihydrodipicolinate synthase/N-acetylneuraminate lyase